MRGGLRFWPVRAAVRGARGEARLLAVLVAIAVLATTVITSFALLVSATERGGLRAALAAVDSDRSSLAIEALRPRDSVRQVRDLADRAVGSVLGAAATARGTGAALSEPVGAAELDESLETLGYLAELDGVQSHARLVDGAWARAGKTGGPVEVTLPQAASERFGLGVGSQFEVQVGERRLRASVTGIYAATEPGGQYWSSDRLQGRGDDNRFPKENVTVFIPTHVFGPLLVAPGGMDAAAIPVRSVDLRYVPDFERVRVGQLAALAERLEGSDRAIAVAMGTSVTSLRSSTTLDDVLADVSTGLVATRTTVIVVSLMLLVLAVAALAQSARLFSDARAGERRLMRARGASSRQLLALAGLDALAIGLASAIVSPLLATLVYRALAAQPAMVAAGMPAATEPTGDLWLVAGAVAAVFVVVLLVPSLRRGDLFVDNDQAKGRAVRGASLIRSGLDLGLVALGVVALMQLQSYTPPADASSSLTLGVIPLAAPAVILLAGALVAVRVLPVVSTLAQRLGARSRGAVLPLAAWEVGRRSQRATAAVVMLTLALAVGTFGESFLSTWRLSQQDQAELAAGAPVRVPAASLVATSGSRPLSDGARGAPQPTIRRTGQVEAPGDRVVGNRPPRGTPATLLGITAPSREVISRGRIGDEGGTTIARVLAAPTLDAGSSIPLPATAGSLLASVQLGSAATARPGVSVRVRAVIADADDLLTTVDLGEVPLDGTATELRGELPTVDTLPTLVPPLRMVGVQFDAFVSDRLEYSARRTDAAARLRVADIRTTGSNSDTDGAVTPAPASVGDTWYGAAADDDVAAPRVAAPAPGSRFDIDLTIPGDLEYRIISSSVTGWTPVTSIPAVMSADLARSVRAKTGLALTVRVPGARVPIELGGSVPLVPGGAPGDQLTADTLGGTDARTSALVIVDQHRLARVLAQSGASGTLADEWWLDVAAGGGRAWVDAHPVAAAVDPPRSSEVLATELQQDPLRVATQAALWLAIAASALLAAIGFAVHATATLRSRRTELAQLRALGLTRRRLVAVLGIESALLCALGTGFGVALGALLGGLVAPLIAISPRGLPPVPSVRVDIPLGSVALLALGVAAVLAVIVVVVAGSQRTADPAAILREGGDA